MGHDLICLLDDGVFKHCCFIGPLRPGKPALVNMSMCEWISGGKRAPTNCLIKLLSLKHLNVKFPFSHNFFFSLSLSADDGMSLLLLTCWVKWKSHVYAFSFTAICVLQTPLMQNDVSDEQCRLMLSDTYIWLECCSWAATITALILRAGMCGIKNMHILFSPNKSKQQMFYLSCFLPFYYTKSHQIKKRLTLMQMTWN